MTVKTPGMEEARARWCQARNMPRVRGDYTGDLYNDLMCLVWRLVK